MTFIVGGVMVIGGSHGLRSGVSDPNKVLVLRNDKYLQWKNTGGFEQRRLGTRRQHSPHDLFLITNDFRAYEYRYLVTDALLWWAPEDLMPLDSNVLTHLRSHRHIRDLYHEEKPDSVLTDARQALEGAALAKNLSVFLSVTQGDAPKMLWPPSIDWAECMIDNLRHLDIQFHLSLPVASREIPGMEKDITQRSFFVDGRHLNLFPI